MRDNGFNRACPSGNAMIDGCLEIKPQVEVLTTMWEVKQYCRREVNDLMDAIEMMRTFRLQGYLEVEINRW